MKPCKNILILLFVAAGTFFFVSESFGFEESLQRFKPPTVEKIIPSEEISPEPTLRAPTRPLPALKSKQPQVFSYVRAPESKPTPSARTLLQLEPLGRRETLTEQLARIKSEPYIKQEEFAVESPVTENIRIMQGRIARRRAISADAQDVLENLETQLKEAWAPKTKAFGEEIVHLTTEAQKALAAKREDLADLYMYYASLISQSEAPQRDLYFMEEQLATINGLADNSNKYLEKVGKELKDSLVPNLELQIKKVDNQLKILNTELKTSLEAIQKEQAKTPKVEAKTRTTPPISNIQMEQ